MLDRNHRGRPRAVKWTTVAIVVGAVSAVAYLVVWFASTSNCSGTGTAYYECQSFGCNHGGALALVELVVVGPALAIAMIWASHRSQRVSIPVWVIAVAWLVVGRFVLRAGLADVIIKHCSGL